MKKEKIILQLGVEIDTLKAHIQRLKKENYKIHQLDVELLQQKARQFYELLFELEKEITTKDITSPPSTVKEKEVQPPKEETTPKPESKAETSPPPVIEKPKEKVEEKKNKKPVEEEIIPPEITPDVAEPDKSTEKQQAEAVKEELPAKNSTTKPQETKSHFDLFSESSATTLSDKFAEKKEENLADKMQGSRIKDLRQSIGINEKFLFINELFNGDMGRYNKVIDEMNEMKTLQGVETYLLEVKVQNQWDDKLPAYLTLKDLAERKFK